MTTVITNVNLNLVSNASVADYRSRTLASAVALLSCYAVHESLCRLTSSSRLSLPSVELRTEVQSCASWWRPVRCFTGSESQVKYLLPRHVLNLPSFLWRRFQRHYWVHHARLCSAHAHIYPHRQESLWSVFVVSDLFYLPLTHNDMDSRRSHSGIHMEQSCIQP